MPKQLSRVVWTEGMHLAQHHFQAQSRYFEDALSFGVHQLFGDHYGLASISFDTDALRNGTVRLRQARGIMPDGLTFQMPDGDPLPAPLDLTSQFSPVRDRHLVRLVIPAYAPSGPNAAGTPSARYLTESQTVRDEITGSDEQPITVGRKNFHLALDADAAPPAHTVHLAIGSIRRDGAGHFVLDEEYIPPILHIGASEALITLLHQLIEILEAKAQSLGGAQRAGGAPLRDYASHEIASFWLRHAILSSLAPLRHYRNTRTVRPETLYLELSRLAGALCTFALDTHPDTLPACTLDTLTDSFHALARHIRAQMDIVVPQSAITLTLRETAPSLYTAPIDDARAFTNSRWILGLRSRAGDAETMTRTPQLVKVCSAKFTPDLVRRAYPGLRLQHLPTPPAAISPRLDMQYFSIDLTGPCWDTLVSTHEVGVYVPDGLPGPEVTIHIVTEPR